MSVATVKILYMTAWDIYLGSFPHILYLHLFLSKIYYKGGHLLYFVIFLFHLRHRLT